MLICFEFRAEYIITNIGNQQRTIPRSIICFEFRAEWFFASISEITNPLGKPHIGRALLHPEKNRTSALP